MDKVKFKAFILERGLALHCFGEQYLNENNWALPVYGFCYARDSDKIDRVSVLRKNGNNLIFNFDKIKLVQYIGLKDKNGKEIYEGDIVSVSYYTLDESGNEITERLTSYVFYCDESLRFCINPPGGKIVELTCEPEVIGNIHQNPELME